LMQIIIFLIISIILFAFYQKLKYDKLWKRVINTEKKKPLPGPTFMQIYNDKKNRPEPVLQFFAEYHETYGDVFFYFFLGLPMLSIGDAEFAMNVLKDVDTFPKYAQVNRFQVEYFGRDSIGIVNGEKWKLLHELFYPLMKDSTIFFQIMDEISCSFADSIEVGRPYVVSEQIAIPVITILGRCIFGTTSFTIDDFEGVSPIFNFYFILQNLNSEMAMLMPWVCYLPTHANRDLSRRISQFRRYFKKMIDEEKKNFDPNTQEASSLIRLLIKGNELDKLSEGSAIDQAVMFFSGGSATPVVTLSIALYLIGLYPDVQAKIHEEVDEFFHHEHVDFKKDIKKLKYLNAVIRETLRKYPPLAQMVPRTCEHDTTIGDVFIPKGTNIQINTWRIQHDPKNYPDPEEFKPERMLGHSPKGKFFTFSEGIRTCAGKSFSLNQMTIFLARLLERYEIRLPEGSQLKFLRDSIILMPTPDLKVTYHIREKK